MLIGSLWLAKIRNFQQIVVNKGSIECFSAKKSVAEAQKGFISMVLEQASFEISQNCQPKTEFSKYLRKRLKFSLFFCV
jgi:hypothetical protein